jgi:hypothetical protein
MQRAFLDASSQNSRAIEQADGRARRRGTVQLRPTRSAKSRHRADDCRVLARHREAMSTPANYATRSRPPLTSAARVNVAGMLAAAAGILIQIATGVDYPTVPPGPIILVAAAAIVGLARWRWASIVGVVVPAFLLVGGTIASFARDDLWDLGEPGQFAGLVLQAAGVLLALASGIRALTQRG